MPTRDLTPDASAPPVTRRLVTGCLLLVLPLLATCRLDDLVNPEPIVARLEIVQPDTVLRSLGEVIPLRVSAFDVAGRTVPRPTTTWSSDNPTIAEVEAQGVVTARANGQTTIRARAGGGADSVRVVVSQAARRLTISPDPTTLRTVSARDTLRAAVLDSAGNPIQGVPVFWTNQAPDTVRIVAAGADFAVVEALREGRADIQATGAAGGDTAAGSGRVDVSYVLATLALAPRQPKLSAVGDTLRFTATGTDATGDTVRNARARWTSSDTARLAIDSATGLATARDSGSALVRAERDGLADATTAQVLPPVLTADTLTFADSALFGSGATRSTSRAVNSAGTLTLGVRARRARGSAWLTITPDTLTLSPGASAPIQLTASASGLAEGTYGDTVVLESRGAAGSPKRIPVVFRIVCSVAPITPDTVHPASLAASDCRSPRRPGSFADLYRFTGTAGDPVRISLNAPQPDLDTWVYLLDAAGAVVTQNDDCPSGNTRNSCLDALLATSGSYTIEATTFAPNVTFSYTLGLTRPVAPAAPTGLGQFRPDNTVIDPGTTTNNTTVVFRATATDPNARDALRLEVQVQAFPTDFTGAPIQQGALVPNATGGVTVSVTVPSLATGPGYRWRARVADQTGRTGPWIPFGVPSSADFTVNATSPILTVTPDAVRDSALQGSTAATVQTLEIANTGTPTFTWSATKSSTWLSLTPASGDPGVSLTLELKPTGLAAGTHRDTVVVTASGALGSPDSIPVTFVIQQPVLRVAPDSVRRETQSGSEATFRDTLRITNTGTGQLTWSAARLGTGTWLTLGKTSGGAPDVVPLTIAAAGLAAGTYHDTVVVTAAGAGASPDSTPIRLVVNPAPPTGLAQLKSDEATVIPTGGTTDESTVKLRATIGEPAAAGQVRLDVEVVAVGQAFTGTPTASSGFGPQNRSAVATVASLPDDVDYRWQARTTDDGGRSSTWVSFGVNSESATDFHAAVPQAPTPVRDSAQLKSDAATAIPLTAITDENTVVFRGTVTDPDPGDRVQLQAEVRPTDVSFTNQPTASSILVSSGSLASVSVSGLAENGPFHWQYRSVDQSGRTSAWIAFGGNVESEADFSVNATPQDPAVPTQLNQFQADGTTPIPVGEATSGDPGIAVLQGRVTDPDPGDLISLEVEVDDVNTEFGNPATNVQRGAAVSANGNATVSVTRSGGLLGTGYHWRARACDQTNRCSPWVPFGGNSDTVGLLNPADTDFRVP